MSEPLLLGVDGGGTSTVAWLADRGGTVIGRGAAGASNAKAVGLDAARSALTTAITAAFAEAERTTPASVACLGLAGFDRTEERATLSAWSSEGRWADSLVLVNDGDLVVAAGTPEGYGVGVIAGTGSIAVGRSPDGKAARAGGWGYLIGDEGSGYDIVRSALKLVVRRADGRDAPRPAVEALSRRLCSALGVDGPPHIPSALYAPEMTRARLASFAPLVLQTASDDPFLAAAVLEPAGVELSELVLAVARALDWEPGPLPLALAGGFLLSADAVSDALRSSLRNEGYDPMVTRVDDPVRGAIVIAGRHLPGATGAAE